MTNKTEYGHQNIYIITGYKCNCKCEFCLFRYKRERQNINCVVDAFKKVIFKEIAAYSRDNDRKKLYVKITGGEPFLSSVLLERIVDICNVQPIYKIGIGTNGTICVPLYINKTNKPVKIYFSRHYFDDKVNKADFGISSSSDISMGYITRGICNRRNIKYAFNCNLIKGRVDSIDKLYRYIEYAYDSGIKDITFRELNKVSLDEDTMYGKRILNYAKYYEENIIFVNDIIKEFKKDKEYVYTDNYGNYYDDNKVFKSKDMSITFRVIDEKKLVEYNMVNKGLDEWVIFPDGAVSQCWMKSKKRVKL